MIAAEMAYEVHATTRYLHAYKKALPAEIRLNNKISGLFNKVIAETVQQLTKTGHVPGDASVVRAVTSAFDKYGGTISQELANGAIDQATAARQSIMVESGIYTHFKDRVKLPDKTYDLIKNRSFEASAQTLARMRGDVIGNLAKSYEEGYGIDKAAEALREKFVSMRDYELVRIARTEINSGQNQGAYETEREFHINYHMWWSADDDRVRDGSTSDADHTYMHGQIVRVGEPFSNGLLYPGDMSGPIEEWINCRCRVVPFLMPEGFMAPAQEFFYESDLLPIDYSPAPTTELEAEAAEESLRDTRFREDVYNDYTEVLGGDRLKINEVAEAQYKDWIVSLSDDEKGAISYYSGQGYEYMNPVYRGVNKKNVKNLVDYFNGDAEEAFKTLKAAENALEKSTAKVDTVSYRGCPSCKPLGKIYSKFHKDLSQAEGLTFSDNGLISTSLDKEESFRGLYNFKINIPKGTKGGCISELSNMPGESEFLLQRGTVFRIDSFKDVRRPDGRYVFEIECTVVEQKAKALTKEAFMSKVAA